jgi:hypothetical protein
VPFYWTNSEETQYRHIVKSEKDRGLKTERAQEIAARTVNKLRREHGEAKVPPKGRR